MIVWIIRYALIGAIWTGWLEYYTTKNLEGDLGSPWRNWERLFHITLWPFSFGVFIYGLIDGFNGEE